MTHRTVRVVPAVRLGLLVGLVTSACVLVVDHSFAQDTDFHVRSSGLSGRLEVWSAGDVTFAADDRAVERIAPGVYSTSRSDGASGLAG